MAEHIYPDHDALVEARRPAPKYAITVNGPVLEDELGTVLPHEHVLIDLRRQHDPLYPELANQPVKLGMLGKLRRHPTTCLDNLVLDDQRLAVDELMAFKRAGGCTLVDLTCTGPRFDLNALPRIAEETGLNIIVGTGLYGQQFYPDWLADESAESLAGRFARDVELGIGGSGVRAGVIGKLELPDLSEGSQQKVLQAAARASLRTGAPLAIECPPGDAFESAHRLLTEEQVEPGKVLLCGMDGVMPKRARERPAELGYYLLFDGIGKEWYVRGGEDRLPRDPERVCWLKEMVNAGFLSRLLLSQGIDRKMLLIRYGGWGYAHIARNILPMMVRERFAPKEITTLTMYNPARVLAFAA